MTNGKIPTPKEYYLNSSLYTSYAIEESDKDSLFKLLFTDESIDCFCIECDALSVFQPDNNVPQAPGHYNFHFLISGPEEWDFNITVDANIFEKCFRCSRDKRHVLYYFTQISGGQLRKVGQFPSIADIAEQDIKQFKRVLGNDYYLEFSKAIGLYAHGIGVGSFVYLRRIIENFIIKPAYEKAKTRVGWDDELYFKSRVKDRISLLKDELPKFLVENPSLYSVISKGIHELNEDDCRKYFPVMRSSLEVILLDLQTKRDAEIKRQELEVNLAKISSEVK